MCHVLFPSCNHFVKAIILKEYFFNTEMILKAMETWKIGTTNEKQALYFKVTFHPKIRYTVPIYARHQFSPYSSSDDPVTQDNSWNLVGTIFFNKQEELVN